MNLYIKEKQTQEHREQTCSYWGEKGCGVWDQQMQTTIHRMDKQGPTIQHRELHSVSCDKP